MTEPISIHTHDDYLAAQHRLKTLTAEGEQESEEAQTLTAALAGYEAEYLDLDAPANGFLEWYAGRKAEYVSRRTRLTAQYEAMLRDIERAEKGFDFHHQMRAEAELRSLLTGRARSVKFLTGTVGLRKKPATVSVSDVDPAHLPPELQETVSPRIDAAAFKRLVKVEGHTAVLATTGEVLDLPGLRVSPEEEVFYVKTGKEDL